MVSTRAFVELILRKERDAAAATLHPYITHFGEPPEDAQAIGNEWTRRLFDGDFYLSPPADPSRPACSLVFVQSSDGNTVARNPSVLGGGETDKHLIYEGLSRVAADAVMAGAATVAGGKVVFSVWHPELVRLRMSLGKPRHPRQIIATLQGVDLDGELLYNVPELAISLVTVPSARAAMDRALAERPWISPIVMNSPERLDDAFAQLRASGVERISCVGGRSLATQLIDAGLVQDVYLTTGPKPGGTAGTPMYPRPLAVRPVVRKAGTGLEQGVVFEHLKISEGLHPSDSPTADVHHRVGAGASSRYSRMNMTEA
jgi:riboflavin biosynthesis pyrimidine reductase